GRGERGAAGGMERGLERDHHEPRQNERFSAAGRGGNYAHDHGENDRRQNMRALEIPGARKLPDKNKRKSKPGIAHDLERARRAKQREMDWQNGDRRDPSKQAGGDEIAL